MNQHATPLDLFSAESQKYARHRPTYPVELFDFLAELAPAHDAAWDVATGNGQAAGELASRFRRVYACDISPQQIEHAPPHPRIDYRVAPAERSGLADRSVDLVTVATAYHWLDHAAFEREVRRVAKPAAIIAAWAYVRADMDPRVRDVITECLAGVRHHWHDRVKGQLDDAALPFPFERIEAPAFDARARWTVDDYLGFADTWSASRNYHAATGGRLVDLFEVPLREAWGERVLELVWPLRLMAGRV